MAYIANILLGRISKAHGFEGAVTVKLEKSFIEKIPDMESVFLEIEGKPVPFFIEESEYPGGDTLRLKFFGYDKVDKVNEFAGCRIFLISAVKIKTDKSISFNFDSYKIFLPDNSLLGTVRSVIEHPGQSLLSIETSLKKEILIPLHEDFVISVDNEKKVLVMDLPEGLIDIN
jgi:16S rRNA processing protein RimM